MKQYHLTAVIWKEGKRYVSKCPELGVASFGATPEKARAALEDVEPALSSGARYTTPLNVAAV